MRLICPRCGESIDVVKGWEIREADKHAKKAGHPFASLRLAKEHLGCKATPTSTSASPSLQTDLKMTAKEVLGFGAVILIAFLLMGIFGSLADDVNETSGGESAVAAAPSPDMESNVPELPDLTGKSLQVAQQNAAELGFDQLASDDLTGADRRVLVAADWIVCTQTPSLGTTGVFDTITLGVVKEDESCTTRIAHGEADSSSTTSGTSSDDAESPNTAATTSSFPDDDADRSTEGPPTSSGPTTSPALPPGLTARCNDGTPSYSQHHRGTCSGHGGVALWYR